MPARGPNVPPGRIEVQDDSPPRADGQFVLYWMTALRRARWNFALDQAVHWAKQLRRPLLVVEVLRCGGRWDTLRRHRFVADGMGDNAAAFGKAKVAYHALVERQPGQASETLDRLARRSSLVVTDDYPLASIAPPLQLAGTRVERVDSNGLVPLRAATRAFPTARGFRRFIEQTLPDCLPDLPASNPLARLALPPLAAWPKELGRRHEPDRLDGIAFDRDIPPVSTRGGPIAAGKTLERFIRKRLDLYGEHRNEPEVEATSGLSPYLHHGHISAHEVFASVAKHERWSPTDLAEKAAGRREGWWGMSPSAEAFLDELVTWREIGYNFAQVEPAGVDRYDALPDWARATLDRHRRDRREHVYSYEEFATAKTHDPLWNAAQRELLRDGTIHNYLRMLWGKKILEWTSSPEEALEVMIDLNNTYALDGCDPNSYSGIAWVLGRYDRPWGPERPIFGTIRYMSSKNTARKVHVQRYIMRQLDNIEEHP